MTPILRLLAIVVFGLAVQPVQAQDPTGPAAPPAVDRSETGGAQTLEDILRRQRGEEVDNRFRSESLGEPEGGAGLSEHLGTLGGASDAEVWRALRFNEANVTSTARGPGASILVQDGGMPWVQFREGPLLTYGGYLLLGTIGFLLLFFLIRGRIRIEGARTGRRITRFTGVERFAHWLLAGSFILLGVTGLISLAGRKFLIPAFGREAFATIAEGSKWIHNNVSWAFMLALVMVFVFWVVHNLPNRTDLVWLARGGGIIGHGHPPARKFNAGQKLIFWSVIILGVSISVSGLSLLFPFELPMFAATFEKLNAFGIPQTLGLGILDADLTPHEEMQLAQSWHAIVSFVLMAIILAHIYIGSIGMEGAFDAMGTGEVEEQWAREHHSLWVEEVKEREARASGDATPAE